MTDNINSEESVPNEDTGRDDNQRDISSSSIDEKSTSSTEKGISKESSYKIYQKELAGLRHDIQKNEVDSGGDHTDDTIPDTELGFDDLGGGVDFSEGEQNDNDGLSHSFIAYQNELAEIKISKDLTANSTETLRKLERESIPNPRSLASKEKAANQSPEDTNQLLIP